jgi:hypothetical protein
MLVGPVDRFLVARTGDVVVRLEGLNANEATLVELQNHLSGDGPFACTVLPGSKGLGYTIKQTKKFL